MKGLENDAVKVRLKHPAGLVNGAAPTIRRK
jgi:hypothetical protein